MNVTIACLVLLLVLSSFYRPLHAEQLLFPCTEENAERVINENTYTLIICSFGGPFGAAHDGWVGASGISFYKVTDTERIFLHQTDEFRDAIDFKYEKGTLYIRTFTDQYHDYDRRIPLIEEKITLSGKTIGRDYKVLLTSKKPEQDEIDQSMKYLDNYRHTGLDSLDKAYKALYVLRDYSIYEPDHVLSFFKQLGEKFLFDGELSETFSLLFDEVELIRKAKKGP